MKYFATLLLAIMQLLVQSQQIIDTLDPGIRKAGQFYESLSFINKIPATNQFLIALAEENNVHFYLFDKNWKSVSQFKEKREWVDNQSFYQDYKQLMGRSNIFFSSDFQPVGSINTEDKQFIIAFLRDHKMFFQKVDFNSANSNNLDVWEPPKKSKILHAFAFDNRVYWITYNKKDEDSIELNRYNPTGKIETKSFSIRRLRTADKVYRPGSSSLGSDFIDNGKQTDLLKTSARIKFYAQNNFFYMVSDEIQGKTQITTVNLDSFEETNYSIEHTPAGNCSFISSQNSFLLNDHLLQVNVCEGTFTFTIQNLTDRKRSTYSFNKDQEINFRNSPVMQYGKSLFSPEERQLNRSSQFIRKVDGSGLSIMAAVADNTIEVTMGSSQLIQSGGGGSMFMPGGSISTPGGTVPLPGRWVSSGFYNTSTKTIFFKSLFYKADLQHIDASLPLDDKMKVVDEFYDKKSNAVYPIIDGKDVITGYLDRDTKKFIIISF